MWTYFGNLFDPPLYNGGRRVACALFAVLATSHAWAECSHLVLDPAEVREHVDRFNACDASDVQNAVPNSEAFDWIADNAPLFDCPSLRFNETYYFRWWTYRKHIVQTPHGRVLTEFIVPVGHAGPYNTISCALGHHIAEGRWLRDSNLLDEYVDFWLSSGPSGGPAEHLHQFSSWLAAALYDRFLVTGDESQVVERLGALIDDYRLWESQRQRVDGLFWQYDVRDGMEESISGGRQVQNVRPTINSYMVANAEAISMIANLAEQPRLAAEFATKAANLRQRLTDSMWDEQSKFFKVALASGGLSDAREAIGYVPWMFDIPSPNHAVAWKQVNDPEGFWAPWGLTTAERRHPFFRTHGTGTCEWDGAVWPFATSQTLNGMMNVLRGAQQPYVTPNDFFEQMLRYATAHQQHGVAYIGEYHDEVTGQWLITGPKAQRSRYYNHSTFNDLVIHGLAGIVPRQDLVLEIDPLVPSDTWAWFCLDGVPYHDRCVTLIWDCTGERYQRGAGLSVWVDGEKIASRDDLGPIHVELQASVQPGE